MGVWHSCYAPEAEASVQNVVYYEEQASEIKIGSLILVRKLDTEFYVSDISAEKMIELYPGNAIHVAEITPEYMIGKTIDTHCFDCPLTGIDVKIDSRDFEYIRKSPFVPGSRLIIEKGFTAWTIGSDPEKIFLLAHDDRPLVVTELRQFNIVAKGVDDKHEIPECIIREDKFSMIRKLKKERTIAVTIIND